MLEEYTEPAVSVESNARDFYGVEMPASVLKDRLTDVAENADTWVTVRYNRIYPRFAGKVCLRGVMSYTNNELYAYECHDADGGRWRLYVVPEVDIVTLQQLPTGREAA